MMNGTGRRGRIELSIDDQPFAVIDDRTVDFEIGGAEYRVRRYGLFGWKYHLLHGDDLIIVAEMQPLLFRFRITHAGRQWLLKPDYISGLRYDLFHDTEKVGRIAFIDWLDPYKDIKVDLPDALSPPAQVFLVWLVARHLPN